jgi:hypothetical protein
VTFVFVFDVAHVKVADTQTLQPERKPPFQEICKKLTEIRLAFTPASKEDIPKLLQERDKLLMMLSSREIRARLEDNRAGLKKIQEQLDAIDEKIESPSSDKASLRKERTALLEIECHIEREQKALERELKRKKGKEPRTFFRRLNGYMNNEAILLINMGYHAEEAARENFKESRLLLERYKGTNIMQKTLAYQKIVKSSFIIMGATLAAAGLALLKFYDVIVASMPLLESITKTLTKNAPIWVLPALLTGIGIILLGVGIFRTPGKNLLKKGEHLLKELGILPNSPSEKDTAAQGNQ